ncbi:MAG: RNA methyltransferase [Deltaproteobacteria bacterium]|nr:RNA methyltransferase [Deltaproteobacteria bacterium]
MQGRGNPPLLLGRRSILTTLERVSVVLVEPMYGGNVGSVARVMANFGLGELVLVNPAPGVLGDPQLEPMARSAVDLVRRARVEQSLEAALAGVEVALAFSTRLGKLRRDVAALRPAVERLAAEVPACRVAGVFGREDRGLTTAEVDHCHWLVRIPTHPPLGSLNLAQAVGLFCYEVDQVRRASAGPDGESGRRVATVDELEGLYGHFERVLRDIGFLEEQSPDRMLNHIRRIFSRRLPDPRDARILRGILSKVELALERARGGPG